MSSMVPMTPGLSTGADPWGIWIDEADDLDAELLPALESSRASATAAAVPTSSSRSLGAPAREPLESHAPADDQRN